MPNTKKGDYTFLTVGKKKMGLVLRTKDNTRPLFISPGHLVDLNDCRDYVLSTVTKYRLPEPTRFAHIKAGERRRSNE